MTITQRQQANRAADLASLHSQVQALDTDLDALVGDVRRQGDQLGKIAVATEVLNANDANLAQRVRDVESLHRESEEKRFQLTRDNESAHQNILAQIATAQLNLHSQIATAITAAMKDMQGVERRQENNERTRTQSRETMLWGLITVGIVFVLGILQTILTLTIHH